MDSSQDRVAALVSEVFLDEVFSAYKSFRDAHGEHVLVEGNDNLLVENEVAAEGDGVLDNEGDGVLGNEGDGVLGNEEDFVAVNHVLQNPFIGNAGGNQDLVFVNMNEIIVQDHGEVVQDHGEVVQDHANVEGGDDANVNDDAHNLRRSGRIRTPNRRLQGYHVDITEEDEDADSP